MSNIKVSILCPSYNHERFIGDFIRSIFAQTEQNFELIIVDDCSVDNNVNEIKKFKDQRIKLIQHKFNQGINAGLNSAIGVAQGEYCVFIASDDMLTPNHLEESISYLDNHKGVGVFYCSLCDVDNEGNPQKVQNHIYYNQDRYKLLHRLFFEGNILASPGMVIRTPLLKKICPLPLGLCQCQDYYMHIELLLQSECFITSKQLVNYRIDYSNKNISAPTEYSKLRYKYELQKVLNSFLSVKSVEQLCLIFDHVPENILKSNSVEFIIGYVAINSNSPDLKCWGYNIIMNFISRRKNFLYLNETIGFTFAKFLSLSTKLYIKNDLFQFIKQRKFMASIILNAIFLLFIICKICF